MQKHQVNIYINQSIIGCNISTLHIIKKIKQDDKIKADWLGGGW